MPMALVAGLTLLLIATPSINSANSSLQQESVISNQGTVLVQDNFASTIFYEYGAESGNLGPFDWVQTDGNGYVETVSSLVHTGVKAMEYGILFKLLDLFSSRRPLDY